MICIAMRFCAFRIVQRPGEENRFGLEAGLRIHQASRFGVEMRNMLIGHQIGSGIRSDFIEDLSLGDLKMSIASVEEDESARSQSAPARSQNIDGVIHMLDHIP